MKKIIVTVSVLFFLTACGNPENYASIPDEHIEQQASTAKRDIQSIVDKAIETSEKKVGNKKRNQMNVKDTVGEKDLGKDPSFTTNVEITNVVIEGGSEPVKTAKQKKPKAKVKRKKAKVATESCEEPCKKKAEPKLDILVYMNRRDSACAYNFRQLAKRDGFLEHFSFSWDWQLSFSYYTEKTNLMPLELYNGKFYSEGGLFSPVYDYVLSEKEYPVDKRDRLFLTTLEMTKYSPRGENNNQTYTPDSKKYVNNPLAGLDHILTDRPEGFARAGSRVVVLLFGDQFPYYSSKDWKKFFGKHQNVNIVSVSSRSANISNFLHVLEQHDQFDALPKCSPAGFIDKVNQHL